MGCSDAAKMLIDQMKEHPEEFRGYGGKFTNMLDMAREAIQGLHRNVRMSQRDATAILAAAEEHLYEVWLAEDVLTMIMKPKEEAEEPKYKVGPTPARIANTSLNAMANISSSNTSTSQYIEHAYRMEMEKYKLELERRQMDDLKRRDNEYATRNTKPFTGFI
jgi:hypothetical protein